MDNRFQIEIFITSHGPYGGDEVNVIDLKKNVKENDFGWPNVSYGEHYNCQQMTERCKKLYLNKPLKKGHSIRDTAKIAGCSNATVQKVKKSLYTSLA